MKKYLLFDLDGTLSDPKVGITRSVQYALEAFGIHVENPDDLCHFIGPPLRESFMKYYGMDESGAEAAVAKYREYFADKGIFENELYDGIPAMLESLRSHGKTLLLATSKPTVFAERILVHFGIEGFFSFIGGSELDGRRSKKDEVIDYVLQENRITALDSAIMVGDREHDIIGAVKTGIQSIGVLYGYGGYDELAKAGATKIVGTVAELQEALLNA